MAVWTIKPGGFGSGRDLAGCRIITTPAGARVSYVFLPPKAVGSGKLGSDTTSKAPFMSGISYKFMLWTVFSRTKPPINPPPDTLWQGECNNGVGDEDGSWTAESGGGGGTPRGGKGSKGSSKKSTKGTKSTSKKAVKSAKSVKGTKSTKSVKSTKGTKSAKGTRSAKKTRGRG